MKSESENPSYQKYDVYLQGEQVTIYGLRTEHKRLKYNLFITLQTGETYERNSVF